MCYQILSRDVSSAYSIRHKTKSHIIHLCSNQFYATSFIDTYVDKMLMSKVSTALDDFVNHNRNRGNMIYLETVGPALVPKIPVLLMWLAGIVLSVLMLRRGGGRAEKLLLSGGAIKFTEQIYGAFTPGFVAYMMMERLRADLTPG